MKRTQLNEIEFAWLFLGCLLIAMGSADYRETKDDCLWMAVTADKYELPLVVADTQNEIATILDVGWTTPERMKLSKGKSMKKFAGENYRIIKEDGVNTMARERNGKTY